MIEEEHDTIAKVNKFLVASVNSYKAGDLSSTCIHLIEANEIFNENEYKLFSNTAENYSSIIRFIADKSDC